MPFGANDEVVGVQPFGANDEVIQAPQATAPQQSQAPSNDLGGMVDAAAQKYGIDQGVFRRLVGAESAGNTQAVSPKGAMGLGQLMPGTAKDLGVTDPFDPVQNLDASARYLRQQLDANNGDMTRALAAYNWGPGNLQKNGLENAPRETRDYITKILGPQQQAPQPQQQPQQQGGIPRSMMGSLPPLEGGNPVEQWLQQNLGPVGQDALQSAGRVAQGVGQGFFNDLPSAAEQVISAALPDSLQRILMPGGQTGVERVQTNEQAYQQQRQQMGGSGVDISRIGGNLINPASTALGAGAAAPNIGRAILSGAGRGAAGAAMMPVDTSDGSSVLEQKAIQTGVGAGLGGVLGGALSGLTSAAGRLIGARGNELPADQAALVSTARQQGIPLAASDISSGNRMLSNIAGTLENTRLPGISLANFRAEQQAASRAAATRVLDSEATALRNMTFRRPQDIQAIASSGGKRAGEAQKVLQMMANAGDDEKAIMQASGNLMWLRHKIRADQLYSQVDQLAAGKQVDPSRTVAAIDKAINDVSGDVGANRADVATLIRLREDLLNPRVAGAADDAEAAASAYAQGGQEAAPLINSFERMKRFETMLQDAKASATRDGTMDRSKLYINDVLRGVRDDLESFYSGNKQLRAAQDRASAYYNNHLVPYREGGLAKALINETPERIWGAFIRAKSEGTGDYAAKKFYNALDGKGKAAVRYGIIKNAFESATEPRGFDAKKFMDAIERTEYKPYFDTAGRTELNGLINLFGHLRKSTPERLANYAPLMMGGGLGAGIGIGAGSPSAAVAGAAATYGSGTFLRWLLTSEAGKRALLSSNALAKGGSKEQVGQFLDRTMRQFTAGAGTAAGAELGLQGQMPAGGDQNAAERRR